MKSVSYRHKWLICSLACFFTAFLIAVSANTCKQDEIDIQVMAVLLRRKQRVLRRIFRGLAAGGITEFAVVFIQQFLHRQTQNTA